MREPSDTANGAGQECEELLVSETASSENTGDARALQMGIAELEKFWVTSVNWCSELSKDIEKIIILYREQL